MNNSNPSTLSRTAQLEAHIRLLNHQLERVEKLYHRWMVVALMGWALVGGMVWAVIVSGGK